MTTLIQPRPPLDSKNFHSSSHGVNALVGAVDHRVRDDMTAGLARIRTVGGGPPPALRGLHTSVTAATDAPSGGNHIVLSPKNSHPSLHLTPPGDTNGLPAAGVIGGPVPGRHRSLSPRAARHHAARTSPRHHHHSPGPIGEPLASPRGAQHPAMTFGLQHDLVPPALSTPSSRSHPPSHSHSRSLGTEITINPHHSVAQPRRGSLLPPGAHQGQTNATSPRGLTGGGSGPPPLLEDEETKGDESELGLRLEELRTNNEYSYFGSKAPIGSLSPLSNRRHSYSIVPKNELPARERAPSHSRSISTDFQTTSVGRPSSSANLPRRVHTSPATGGILSQASAGSRHTPLPIGSGRLNSISSSIRNSNISSGISRSGSGTAADHAAAAAAASAHAALSHARQNSSGGGGGAQSLLPTLSSINVVGPPTPPSAHADRYLNGRTGGLNGSGLRSPPNGGGPNGLLPLAGAAPSVPSGVPPAVAASARRRASSPLQGVEQLLNTLAEENNKLHLQLMIVYDIFQHGLQDSQSREVAKAKSAALALRDQNSAIVDKILSTLVPDVPVQQLTRERSGSTERRAARAAAAQAAAAARRKRFALRSGSMPPMAAAAAHQAAAAAMHRRAYSNVPFDLSAHPSAAEAFAARHLARRNSGQPMDLELLDELDIHRGPNPPSSHVSPAYHHHLAVPPQPSPGGSAGTSAVDDPWAAATRSSENSPYLRGVSSTTAAHGDPNVQPPPPLSVGMTLPTPNSQPYDSTSPFGNQPESPPLRARPYRVVQCKYEYRPGGCPRGESCTFKHTKTPYENAVHSLGGSSGQQVPSNLASPSNNDAAAHQRGPGKNGMVRHERTPSSGAGATGGGQGGANQPPTVARGGNNRKRDGGVDGEHRTPAPSSSLCKHWNKLSGCQYRGGHCRFTHQCNNCDSPLHGYFQCEQKCRKFEEGSCVYGNRCFLRHGDGPAPRLYNASHGSAGMSSPYPVPQAVGGKSRSAAEVGEKSSNEALDLDKTIVGAARQQQSDASALNPSSLAAPSTGGGNTVAGASSILSSK